MIGSSQKLLMARAGVRAGGVPYEVGGAVFETSLSVPTTDGGSVWFKDGSTMFCLENIGGNAHVSKYSLSTPWNISTATFQQSLAVNSLERDAEQLMLDPTGSYLYVSGSLNDQVRQWVLSTAWDLSTATFDGSGPTGNVNPRFFIKSDGTVLYSTSQGSAVKTYPLSTAWDVTSFGSATTLTTTTTPHFIKEDGSKVYNIFITDQIRPTGVSDVDLSTPWDLDTGTTNTTFDAKGSQDRIRGVFIGDGGKKMYLPTDGSIVQYRLA